MQMAACHYAEITPLAVEGASSRVAGIA